MIKIASTLASAWARTGQRTQRDNYAHLTAAAQEQAEKIRKQYEEKNAYLFRSAAETTRLAYENARAQLAARQAKWAANGLTDQSASVAEARLDLQHEADQQQAKAQAQLQTEAAQNEQEKNTAWQKLLAAMSAYRKATRKKNGWGSLKKAIGTLFN